MEKEKLESLIIDYIDNKLNTVDRHMVEQELVKNPDAYKLYEELKEVLYVMDKTARLQPSDKLKTNFEKMLKQEGGSGKSGKTIFFQPMFYRAAVIIIGVALVFWISRDLDQKNEIARIRKEMESTKMMLMNMLQNQQSASQRIQGVNVAMSIDKADDEVVNALVKTMNEDPNTNVRLAALDALSKFKDEPLVKKELINALSKQKDPIVQIALIQLMVQLKEKDVVKDLQRIVDDEGTLKAVKDEAYSGIMKLS